MPAISLKARKEITKLISELVNKYLQKATESPSANSGNPFVMAILKDFEPLLHRIHGLKGSMGNEMEKIAEIIALDSWGQTNVKRKSKVVIKLPINIFQAIDGIMSNLTNVKNHPNYQNEKKLLINAIKKSSKKIQEHKYEFDLSLYDSAKKQYYYLEMKGPDPNTTEVPGAKRRLLTALASGIVNHKTEKVDVAIGVYYNNKHPKPYNNPKVLNYFDPAGDIKVHEEFWNFLGKNRTTYSELLNLFENYGKKNKKKIWAGFSKLIYIK
jgi:hypothetical protein